jgi:hypothetical protein
MLIASDVRESTACWMVPILCPFVLLVNAACRSGVLNLLCGAGNFGKIWYARGPAKLYTQNEEWITTHIIIKQYTCSVADKVILIPTKKYLKHANGKIYRIPSLRTVSFLQILPADGRTVSVLSQLYYGKTSATSSHFRCLRGHRNNRFRAICCPRATDWKTLV